MAASHANRDTSASIALVTLTSISASPASSTQASNTQIATTAVRSTATPSSPITGTSATSNRSISTATTNTAATSVSVTNNTIYGSPFSNANSSTTSTPSAPGREPTPNSTKAPPLTSQKQSLDFGASTTPRKRDNKAQTAAKSMLRSIGVRLRVTGTEKKKVIVSQSRLLALSRSGVHIIPIVISTFLIALNGKVLLNGPPPSTTAVLFLQLAAKYHELTIVGSLMAIALDLIRYHALHDRINLGLITAGLSVSTPSWLWSLAFVGGSGTPSLYRKLRDSYRSATLWETLKQFMPRAWRKITSLKRSGLSTLFSSVMLSKMLLMVFLVFLTVLSTLVGPASALLFIPTERWVDSASTDFYVRGTPDMLWPDILTSNHTGHPECGIAPIPVHLNSCLNGGWQKLVPAVENLDHVLPWFDLYIPGGPAYRFPPETTIIGGSPVVTANLSLGAADTFAMAPHLAVATNMAYLHEQVNIAFQHAKGRNRRLRKFKGDGFIYMSTIGKFPMVRTLCSNVTKVTNSSDKIGFPLLTSEKEWRPRRKEAIGPLKYLQLSSLDFRNWTGLDCLNGSATKEDRAVIIPLPDALSIGSAAMVHMSQFNSTAYARGCVVDARWATGQTLRTDRTVLYSWSSSPGIQMMNSVDGDFIPTRYAMFDEHIKSYIGPPIRVEPSWLGALTPNMPEASLPGNSLVMNSFEALLNRSYSKYHDYNFGHWEFAGHSLEYATTLFFINALSRIGFEYQLGRYNSSGLNPDLWTKNITDDEFISGKMIYNRRDPSEPYVLGHFKVYRYGTAWSLTHPAQIIAATILGVHLALAAIHTMVLFALGISCEAWNTIYEWGMLAYNSEPRSAAFKNCSSGIMYASTLETEFRIGTRARAGGDEQAELVVCESDDEAGSVVIGKEYC